MGCGSTRAAVAPVFSDLVPVQGGGSVSAAVSEAKKGWEEAARDEQFHQPCEQLEEGARDEQVHQPCEQLEEEKQKQQWIDALRERLQEGARDEQVHQACGQLEEEKQDKISPPPDSGMLQQACANVEAEQKHHEDPHQHAGVGLQGPGVAPINCAGEQKDHGEKMAPKRSGRIHTFDDVPMVAHIKDQHICLNENMVPEPLNLKDYESFKYNCTREHFEEGHPLAPCWPSHQRHIKRIAKNLKQFAKFPDKFTDLVMKRRAKQFEKLRERERLLLSEEGDD
eukprot:TRINITY_DN6099_c0_g1_i1.p1 TRINITY_DN6099_c0_g1~~TRINITY_DN6099_c0_g1_i1.p1  ORF type:complete len:282 (-),score=65.59 TRINITY_DN6099_c0_g1_i1:430-1275(-)